jgi:predicted nucleic acid-binding protein
MLAWAHKQGQAALYVSELTLAQLRSAAHAESDPLIRENWLDVLDREVHVTFGPRVLVLDRRVLQEWSLIERRRLADGAIAPTVESLTVATAKAHGLTYLTRQSPLAVEVGCAVENPWGQAP